MPFICSPLSLCAMITLRSGFDRTGRAHSLSLPHRGVTGTDARILLAVNWELVQPALGTACWSPHGTVSETPQARDPQSDQGVSPQLFSFPARSHLCFMTATQQDHRAHLSIALAHLQNPFHSNRDSAS